MHSISWTNLALQSEKTHLCRNQPRIPIDITVLSVALCKVEAESQLLFSHCKLQPHRILLSRKQDGTLASISSEKDLLESHCSPCTDAESFMLCRLHALSTLGLISCKDIFFQSAIQTYICFLKAVQCLPQQVSFKITFWWNMAACAVNTASFADLVEYFIGLLWLEGSGQETKVAESKN